MPAASVLCALKREFSRYLRAYRDRFKVRYDDSVARTVLPNEWGFHPYVDIKAEQTDLTKTGTHQFMRIQPSGTRTWFTEAGSRVDYKSQPKDAAGNPIPRNSLATQARETRYLVDRLATYRGRVDRLY